MYGSSVFIKSRSPSSIKTRIETLKERAFRKSSRVVAHCPLKQGLRPDWLGWFGWLLDVVAHCPLKQGLRLFYKATYILVALFFVVAHCPLKQGLRRYPFTRFYHVVNTVVVHCPLKQGLRH